MENQGAKEADWRCQAASTLAQPFTDQTGFVFPKGSEVVLQTIVRRGSNQLLALLLPNATAMLLDTARESFVRSEELLNDVEKQDTKGGVTSLRHDSDAFDLIGYRAASVVFAFCALEAFANEMLPGGYTHRIERADGRCAETYSAAQIERWLQLDTKLGDILPAVLSRPSPKGGHVWQAYAQLRDARDRVIHMKTDDRRSAGPDEDTIWSTLIRIAPPHDTAKAMIDHFLEGQVSLPRWASRYPIS